MKLTGFCVAAGAFVLAGTLMVQAQGDSPGRPHLLVDVSAGLVNATVRQEVDRTEPFDDVIKEVPNSGVHRTVGSVRAELVPSPRHAAFDVVFTACTYGRAIGFRRITQV